MTNAEKLTLAKHACHIRMGVNEEYCAPTFPLKRRL